MRNFLMNFSLRTEQNVKEVELDLFEDAFIDVVQAHGFTVGGGLIEVDENRRRIDGFKTDEERLAIYDQVNATESLEELADVIRSLADEQGNIQGRTRVFPAEKMAFACEHYHTDYVPKNTLTREYGIRQQAMCLEYYQPNKSLKG